MSAPQQTPSDKTRLIVLLALMVAPVILMVIIMQILPAASIDTCTVQQPFQLRELHPLRISITQILK